MGKSPFPIRPKTISVPQSFPNGPRNWSEPSEENMNSFSQGETLCLELEEQVEEYLTTSSLKTNSIKEKNLFVFILNQKK